MIRWDRQSQSAVCTVCGEIRGFAMIGSWGRLLGRLDRFVWEYEQFVATHVTCAADMRKATYVAAGATARRGRKVLA